MELKSSNLNVGNVKTQPNLEAEHEALALLLLVVENPSISCGHKIPS